MKKMFDYSYRHNEWTILYVDCDGNCMIEFCDTKEQAIERIQEIYSPIGMITTSFYNYYIADKKLIKQGYRIMVSTQDFDSCGCGSTPHIPANKIF